METNTKEYQIKALKNRLQVITEKGKYSQGIVRKLERQIRNLEKED